MELGTLKCLFAIKGDQRLLLNQLLHPNFAQAMVGLAQSSPSPMKLATYLWNKKQILGMESLECLFVTEMTAKNI